MKNLQGGGVSCSVQAASDSRARNPANFTGLPVRADFWYSFGTSDLI